MPSPILLQRLSKFLRSSQTALVVDCESVLQMEHAVEPGGASPFSWRDRLTRMIDDVATQLTATAQGEGWNIAGAVSDEAGGEHGAIQCLLLEASMVRNFFLRALNRFQATQAGLGGFTATEMTEVRQEAMDMFDRVTTSALSEWIRQLKTGSPSDGVASDPETPEPPSQPLEPQPLPKTEGTTATLDELRQNLHAVSLQIGKLRTVVPTGQDGAAVAVMRHLQRMSSLLESLGGSTPVIPEIAAPQPIRVAPLTIRAFLEALADAFRPLAEQKGLRFVISVDSNLATVETDAPKLHRAASLLLGNAVNYTANGGVSLTARASGRDWLLIVEDTGPGMEGDTLRRLLTGVPMGPDRVPHGIAVARELINLLGGHLDADSIVRRGSRFTICLPRTRRT